MFSEAEINWLLAQSHTVAYTCIQEPPSPDQFAQINLVPRTNIFVARIGPRTIFQDQLSSDSQLPPQVSHRVQSVMRDKRALQLSLLITGE